MIGRYRPRVSYIYFFSFFSSQEASCPSFPVLQPLSQHPKNFTIAHRSRPAVTEPTVNPMIRIAKCKGALTKTKGRPERRYSQFTVENDLLSLKGGVIDMKGEVLSLTGEIREVEVRLTKKLCAHEVAGSFFWICM